MEQVILTPQMMSFILGLIVGIIVPDRLGRRKLENFAVWAINRLPGEDVKPRGKNNE